MAYFRSAKLSASSSSAAVSGLLVAFPANSESNACANGSPVGFLVLVDEGGVMLLDNVAVLPDHRGRGVGRALLELAEDRATARGRTRIRLFTHVTMVENQVLYQRIGYAETHRSTDDGVTRVFYEKVL